MIKDGNGIKKLAEAHWGYVAGVLAAHGASDRTIAICGHHYRTAFAHGYKHATEDMDDIISYTQDVLNDIYANNPAE